MQKYIKWSEVQKNMVAPHDKKAPKEKKVHLDKLIVSLQKRLFDLRDRQNALFQEASNKSLKQQQRANATNEKILVDRNITDAADSIKQCEALVSKLLKETQAAEVIEVEDDPTADKKKKTNKRQKTTTGI